MGLISFWGSFVWGSLLVLLCLVLGTIFCGSCLTQNCGLCVEHLWPRMVCRTLRVGILDILAIDVRRQLMALRH